MIWIPNVLCGTKPTCYVEGKLNALGVMTTFTTLRACSNHIALNGNPALYAALRVEGGLMSTALEVLTSLQPGKRITYTFNAARALFLTVELASLSKTTLQAALDAALGAGKATVV